MRERIDMMPASEKNYIPVPYIDMLVELHEVIPKHQSITLKALKLICYGIERKYNKKNGDLFGNVLKYAEQAGFKIENDMFVKVNGASLVKKWKHSGLIAISCHISSYILVGLVIVRAMFLF